MSVPVVDHDAQRAILSLALRGIRRRRELPAADVARRMGMAKRTYEYLEAGPDGLRLDRIQLFADAADSDALAIIAAMMMGTPELALRCADSKLLSILQGAVGQLNSELGDDMFHLTARDCLCVVKSAFGSLAEIARRRHQAADTFEREAGARPSSRPSACPPHADPGSAS